MKKVLKYFYFLVLIIILFYRSSEYRRPNFDNYLNKWIPLLFKNRVIFVNIIGNILLFIPFGMMIKKIEFGFFVILCIEIMQYYTKRGVFDIVDIILNGIGLMIGKVWRDIYGRRKTRGID